VFDCILLIFYNSIQHNRVGSHNYYQQYIVQSVLIHMMCVTNYWGEGLSDKTSVHTQ